MAAFAVDVVSASVVLDFVVAAFASRSAAILAARALVPASFPFAVAFGFERFDLHLRHLFLSKTALLSAIFHLVVSAAADWCPKNGCAVFCVRAFSASTKATTVDVG